MKNLFFLLCALVVHSASAQRLPDLQNKEVKSPATVRIDGNDNEWNSEYAAYNKKLDVYYTLSNDDKNLYLVLKSKFDGKDINKIIAAGFRLALNVNNKKDAENSFNVSYPIRPSAPSQGGQPAGAMGVQTLTVVGGSVSASAVSFSMRNLDSAMLANRISQLGKAKEIKVFGFPAIQDSLISIYNEHNIKVAAKFNDDKEYIYELAIPLNLMGLNATQAKEISYQLRTNPIVRISPVQESSVSISGGGTFQVVGGGGMGGFNENLIPNEVWGKYTLIKH